MAWPEEAKVNTAGGEVHLDIYHRESPYAWLYLHPAGCYAGMFQQQLAQLAEAGFTVVGMDLPGHGRSGRNGDFTLSEAAREVLVVGKWIEEELGVQPGLFGSSLGGVIGSHALILDGGKRFPAAVLHSPAGTPEEARAYSRFPRLFARLLGPYHGVEERLVKLVPGGVRKGFPLIDPGRWKMPIPLFFNPGTGKTQVSWERILWAFSWARHPLKISCYSLRAFTSLIDTPLPGGLETIAVPVLVLLPEEDHIVPHEFIIELAGKIPNGEIVSLPGGHNIFETEESTKQTITLVAQFAEKTLGEDQRWVKRVPRIC